VALADLRSRSKKARYQINCHQRNVSKFIRKL